MFYLNTALSKIIISFADITAVTKYFNIYNKLEWRIKILINKKL